MPTFAGQVLLSTFERIRIFSLASTTERRHEVAAELARLGHALDGQRIAVHQACRKLETWLAMPELGFQRPSRTDIHDLTLLDRAPALRPAANLARRAKRWVRSLGV